MRPAWARASFLVHASSSFFMASFLPSIFIHCLFRKTMDFESARYVVRGMSMLFPMAATVRQFSISSFTRLTAFFRIPSDSCPISFSMMSTESCMLEIIPARVLACTSCMLANIPPSDVILRNISSTSWNVTILLDTISKTSPTDTARFSISEKYVASSPRILIPASLNWRNSVPLK